MKTPFCKSFIFVETERAKELLGKSAKADNNELKLMEFI
jgi:hypothetical protein